MKTTDEIANELFFIDGSFVVHRLRCLWLHGATNMSKISIFEYLVNYTNEPDRNGCITPIVHYFPGFTEHQTKPIYPTFYGKPSYKVLYEAKCGPIKKGNVVRHLCGNKKCININHLREGTQSENRLDESYHKQGLRLVYDKYSTRLTKIWPICDID